jgi:hypothetical protein
VARCGHCPAPVGAACPGEGVARLCELAATRADYRRLLAGGGIPAPAPPTAGQRPPTTGAGTYLTRWLGWAGIRATPGCGCADLAAKMDAMPPDWTLEHLAEVVDAMRAEASRRGLPFSAAIARALVRRAVRKAKARAGEGPGGMRQV